MSVRVNLIIFVLSVGLVFSSPLWAYEDESFKWNNIVTAIISLVAVFVSLYAVKMATVDTSFKMCKEILDAVEYDLLALDIKRFLDREGEIKRDLLARKVNIEAINGMEYYELYSSFYVWLNNQTSYEKHLKEERDYEGYNFGHPLKSLYIYILDKQYYSHLEIISVIDEVEKSRMPKLFKKFLYRKIRRICFRYYNILNKKLVANVGYPTTAYNTITKYAYDIPIYKEYKVGNSIKWKKTTIFTEYKYDQLYKKLVEYKVMKIGFSMGHEK